MRKVLLTMVAAVSTFAAQSQWINQTLPLTYDGYINDIEVVDANTVWGNPWNGTAGAASPYTADFVRTIDGGTTWTVGTVPAGGDIIANIWPISATTCYVSTVSLTVGGGGVYKTVNGGSTWTDVTAAGMFTQATSFADVVYFWDANNGMAMGDPAGPGASKYEIWTTNNAGATWTRTPAANIPALANAGEYGITNLFAAAGGSIWFGTTYGDIYRSTDMGLTWSKSATGLPAGTAATRQDINDIAFYDANNGLVVQVDATNGTTLLKTTDGGATWTSVTPTGTFYPTEIEGVPGSNIIVSGSSNATAGFGTSFSNDLGTTWTDIDAGVSHTSLDFVNSTTGYGGEFITVGSVGGAWKFNGLLAIIPCGDPLVSVGASTVNNSVVCFGDTLVFSTAGAVSPTTATSGYGVLVSSADISGNNDPLNSGSVLGSTGIIPPTTNVILPNDGSIFPAGVYYLTAVVFGNAVGSGQLTTLTFDPACTTTGQSVMVNVLASGDPLCAQSTTPDECAVAVDVNFQTGQPIGVVTSSGPYDNTTATTGAQDPATGFECFGEPDGTGTAPALDNTLWFTFTGDGDTYFIEATNTCSGASANPLDDNDSQIAIYSGTCGALTPVACNEDGPNATASTYPAGLNFTTTAGTVYYVLVDGFNFQGTVSNGEFCFQMTRLLTVACGSGSISNGTVTASNDSLCFGDTLVLSSSGIVAPTVGTYAGRGWIITTAPVSTPTDPLNDPAIVTSYGFGAPPASGNQTLLINDGAFIGGAVPFGVYYWTPVLFGNATAAAPNPQFLQDLTLDPLCTYTGTSIMVEVFDNGDPNCTVGLNDLNGKDFSISSVFPVPVKDMLNFVINAKNASDVTVYVKDILGRSVYTNTTRTTSGLNKVSVPMAKYTAGVYTITVANGKNVATSKFVKQ